MWEREAAAKGDQKDPLIALTFVFDLSEQNAIDPEGRDAGEMEDVINHQQRALDMVVDLAGLYKDNIRTMMPTIESPKL